MRRAIPPMHPNCAAVNEILRAAGLTGRVRMLDEAVTTARAAAEHLGCPVGAIANSLIFETFQSCERRHARAAREPCFRGSIVDHDQWCTSSRHEQGRRTAWSSAPSRLTGVRTRTHRPADRRCRSGRSPTGPSARSSIARSAEFDELWAAGGIPHAVFPLTYDELIRLTGGVEADVS